MSNNPDKSLSRLRSARNANCNSQCAGREGNPTGSPSGLSNAYQLNIVAKLRLLQNEPIICMKTKGCKKAHPNPKDMPGGETLKSHQYGTFVMAMAVMVRRGNFAAAIQAYQEALKLDPNDADLKLGLARALSLGGHNEESKSLYQELLSKSPDDADALEGLGHAFLRSDHPLEARAVFKRLSAQQPANPEFQTDLARVEARLGHYKQAREILSAVLTFHPDRREARLQLAYVDLYQGRYAPALAGFARVLKADPTDFEALLGNARLLFSRENYLFLRPRQQVGG